MSLIGPMVRKLSVKYCNRRSETLNRNLNIANQIVFIFGTLKLATQYPVYTRGTKTHTKNAHTRGYRTRDNSNVQNFITLKNVFDEVQTFTLLKMFQINPNALTREFVRLRLKIP